MLLLSPVAHAAGPIVDYPTINPPSNPSSIVTTSDGNAWYAASASGTIVKIAPGGAMTEYTLPSPGASVGAVSVGSDGNLWFSDQTNFMIIKMTPAGVMTEYPFSDPSGDIPTTFVVGADNNMWFVIPNTEVVGYITPSGTYTTFDAVSDPDPSYSIGTIVTGGAIDGDIWYIIAGGPTGPSSFDRLARIAPSGTITTYDTLPDNIATNSNFVKAPNDTMVFVNRIAGTLGRVDSNGTILYDNDITSRLPTGGGVLRLTAAPDNATVRMAYVNASYTDNGLLTYNVDGTYVSTLDLDDRTVTAMAYNAGGDLWMVDFLGDRIVFIEDEAVVAGAPGPVTPPPPVTGGNTGAGGSNAGSNGSLASTGSDANLYAILAIALIVVSGITLSRKKFIKT